MIAVDWGLALSGAVLVVLTLIALVAMLLPESEVNYPEPRHCAAVGDTCHLGHPYNCRRYLREVAGIEPTEILAPPPEPVSKGETNETDPGP